MRSVQGFKKGWNVSMVDASRPASFITFCIFSLYLCHSIGVQFDMLLMSCAWIKVEVRARTQANNNLEKFFILWDFLVIEFKAVACLSPMCLEPRMQVIREPLTGNSRLPECQGCKDRYGRLRPSRQRWRPIGHWSIFSRRLRNGSSRATCGC